MTILVKLNENLDTWGIVELQGDLKSRVNENTLLSQYVGDLHFGFQNKEVPILIIGHHILYGKCVTLDKPLAVLKKICEDENVQNGENTEYVVEALVKKKLLFKIRPKPIIPGVPNV